MASEDKGFMAQLTGFDGDETQAVLNAPGEKDLFNRVRNMVAGGGAQLGAGVAGAAAHFRGQDVGAAMNSVTDPYVAGRLGIRPEELAARRQVRKELGSMTQKEGEGMPAFRLRMAKKAVEVAQIAGSPQQLAQALKTYDSLRKEQTEFAKLEAETKEQEFDAAVATGYDANGDPTTGVPAVQGGQSGLMIPGPNGEPTFRPFGPDFTEIDPTRKANGQGFNPNEPGAIAAFFKKNRGVESVQKVQNLAISASVALDKTDRVVSTLMDLWEHGGVESVIGMSGELITSVDNFTRNVMGVINSFAGGGVARDQKAGLNEAGQTRSFAGMSGIRALGEAGTHWLNDLIQLPEGVSRTSASAQQHRAAVMEMAYMAARLAEPSNRGLSDNDIANALKRIAGDTSNPQAMIRRFIEMQVDAAKELDYALSTFHGSMGPTVSDEQINVALLGKGYQDYKTRKDELFETYGVTIQRDGRAVFDQIIDTDVQPGEGIYEDTGAGAELGDMSTQEFVDSLEVPEEM